MRVALWRITIAQYIVWVRVHWICFQPLEREYALTGDTKNLICQSLAFWTLPDFGDLLLPTKFWIMEQCKMCKTYFHQECEHIPQSAIECNKVSWFWFCQFVFLKYVALI
jgi:hypothetical protein